MDLARKIKTAQRIAAEYSAYGLDYYLNSVVINASPEPKMFGAIAEPWQRELIEPKIPAIHYLAGFNPGYVGPRSFLDILPRGHDKSSLEGRIVTWLLMHSKRRIHAYIVATDLEQGQLIIEAMEDEAKLNPWVYEKLEFARRRVVGPAGTVDVLPADGRSAFGLRGNFYICDEFTHWKKDDMWRAVQSGREKIDPTLLIVLSNAGLIDSWQDEIRKTAHADPEEWCVFEREGQLASWMKAERVAKMRKTLPPSEAKRVIDNQWIDPAEEHDYLRRYEVEACADLGRSLGLMYRLRAEHGVKNYVASIDYGARRDRTALCLVHLDGNHVLRVDRLDVWQGSPDSPVQLTRVNDWINEIQNTFKPKAWVVDPHQMEETVQRMEGRGLPVERFASRGGHANFLMAQHLRSVIVNRELAWYPNAGMLSVTSKQGETREESLDDELPQLVVKHMSYGFRFDHQSGRHDDRAVAVTMAALKAVEFPASGTGTVLLPKKPQPKLEANEFSRYHRQ